MKDLRELFFEQLADVYDAEKQLLKALPKMAGNASSSELESAFREHLDQTETQIERLEEVFEILGKQPKGKKCEAMAGLIAEAKEMMEESEANVKDAALIAAAQKVEHYEIASYGCLRTWADLLEMDQASTLLQETLDEEKETDEKLTDLAGRINVEAREDREEIETSSRERRGGRKTGKSAK